MVDLQHQISELFLLTNDDVRELSNACRGLRSINTKKNENRKEYVELYKEE